MKSLMKKNRKGAALLEYLMLVMLIAMVVVAAVRTFGVNLDAHWDGVNAEVTTW